MPVRLPVILLVGPSAKSTLPLRLQELGWGVQTTSWRDWMEIFDPALGTHFIVVDMTGGRPPHEWEQLTARLALVTQPVSLVVDGPVPAPFQAPQPWGGWVGLLPFDASADVIRALLGLARQALPKEQEDELTRQTERLALAVHRVQNELEALRSMVVPVPDGGPLVAHTPLSLREEELTDLLMTGLPISILAGRLGIAESTVKKHIASIYRKHGISSRAELMARGRRGR